MKTIAQSTTLKNKALTLALGATLFLAPLAGADVNGKWIHVKVDGKDKEQVSINLPVSFALSALAMVPAEAQVDGGGNIKIDGHDFEWSKMRAMWDEVKRAPEATFVTIQSEDENVSVSKEGGFLLVRTTERTARGANVDVKLPLAVVDALLSGPDGTLNVAAALEELSRLQDGHILTVESEDETVKIWIDGNAESR
jgi:hypothetical protein